MVVKIWMIVGVAEGCHKRETLTRCSVTHFLLWHCLVLLLAPVCVAYPLCCWLCPLVSLVAGTNVQPVLQPRVSRSATACFFMPSHWSYSEGYGGGWHPLCLIQTRCSWRAGTSSVLCFCSALQGDTAWHGSKCQC